MTLNSSPALLGIILFVVGILVTTLKEGIIIDPVERWYQYYFSVLSIKFGGRKNLDSYTDILCLRYKKKYSLYTEYQGEKEMDGGVRHEIYLASPNHLNMILIKTANSNVDAEAKAHELGQQLGLEWVQYNPGARRPRKVLGGKNVRNIATKA